MGTTMDGALKDEISGHARGHCGVGGVGVADHGCVTTAHGVQQGGHIRRRGYGPRGCNNDPPDDMTEVDGSGLVIHSPCSHEETIANGAISITTIVPRSMEKEVQENPCEDECPQS